MVETIMQTRQAIVLDELKDQELSSRGYTIFSCLKADQIDALKQYYFKFQKDDPAHFYSSSHSPDAQFRKQTSDFIKEIVEPIVSVYLKNYRLLGGAYVVKPAHGKGILQPHQDWNLVDEEKNRSYNLWIPLVNVDVHNGAVFVWDGSHSKKLIYRGPGINSVFQDFDQITKTNFVL